MMRHYAPFLIVVVREGLAEFLSEEAIAQVYLTWALEQLSSAAVVYRSGAGGGSAGGFIIFLVTVIRACAVG